MPLRRKVFEFFDVNRDETLSLVVMDADKMSRDEEVGKVTIPVRSVIESGEFCPETGQFNGGSLGATW